MKRILVTGGMGYIGSHTCVELINSGFEVVIIDNLSNSDVKVLEGIRKITGVTPKFYETDLNDKGELFDVLARETSPFDAVMHFAAHKSVGESMTRPVMYYANNINSLANVLDSMRHFHIGGMVFSSSCTVYGQPEKLPVDEATPLKTPESPYGKTKRVCEMMIEDFCRAEQKVNAVALRYFNPVGADDSGIIGELPKGVPSNLVPFITQTAAGLRPVLNVYGKNYNTPDGTAVRDYIHVTDLAKAHIAALHRMLDGKNKTNFEYFNIGTGKGLSVSEIISCFESVNKVKIPVKVVERRKGDIECIYADTMLAQAELGWKPEKTLEDMMRSAWKWQLSLMGETVNKFVAQKNRAF